jgi:formyl-CoA transferase
VPPQAGNNHPTSIPTGVFRTRDGHINIATAGSTMWERLCRAIGGEALLDNPLYATAAARAKNRDQLNVALDSHLADRTSAEWLERLNTAGVPSGPINTIDEVFADPQVEHLSIVQEINTGDARGTLRAVGQPVTLGRTASHLAAAPPQRGEQTDEILREFDYSDSDIAKLRQAKVI